jgi:peptidoglycan/xylan/chitin deacetylase (PgdA/CDA1 family)
VSVNSDGTTMRVHRFGRDFRWPNGARVAIVFNIAYEAWSDGKAPGIGPMGNVLQPGYFDTNAHSWASYGATRGIQRLAGIAARHGIRTSVMVNGVLAEKHPQSVADLHRAGHDIVAHSYGMDIIPVYLDEAAERANVRHTTDLIERASGVRTTGWISPRGTGSLITPRVLAEEGYTWHGDCNDDDLPAVVEVDTPAGTRRIVAIPLTMDVNDLPHVIRYGNSPGALVAHFREVLQHAMQADDAPFMLDVTAHTHVLGRPAGAWAYGAMMGIACERRDIWIGTRAEIAQLALERAPKGVLTQA